MTEQDMRLAALNAAVATSGPHHSRVVLAEQYLEFIQGPKVVETPAPVTNTKATKKNG